MERNVQSIPDIKLPPHHAKKKKLGERSTQSLKPSELDEKSAS